MVPIFTSDITCATFENTRKVVVGGPTNVIDRVDRSIKNGALPRDVHKVIGESAVRRTESGIDSENSLTDEHKKARDAPNDDAHSVTLSECRINECIAPGGFVLVNAKV